MRISRTGFEDAPTTSTPLLCLNVRLEQQVDAMKTHVLLVENDVYLADLIAARLRQNDEFSVDVVTTCHGALVALASDIPDMLVLDTAVPDLSATEFCREIRAQSCTRDMPLVLVSECSALVPVVGLDSGADDYIPKPLDNERNEHQQVPYEIQDVSLHNCDRDRVARVDGATSK